MIRAALADLVRLAVREETNELMAELVELRAEVQRLTAALSAGPQRDPSPTAGQQQDPQAHGQDVPSQHDELPQEVQPTATQASQRPPRRGGLLGWWDRVRGKE